MHQQQYKNNLEYLIKLQCCWDKEQDGYGDKKKRRILLKIKQKNRQGIKHKFECDLINL